LSGATFFVGKAKSPFDTFLYQGYQSLAPGVVESCIVAPAVEIEDAAFAVIFRPN
jgi:hypothetical protein